MDPFTLMAMELNRMYLTLLWKESRSKKNIFGVIEEQMIEHNMEVLDKMLPGHRQFGFVQ